MLRPGFKLTIGAPVEATDGHVGRLRQVLLDPQQLRVSGLVVRRRVLLARNSVVPLKEVADATEHGVRLRVDRAALEQPPATILAFASAMRAPESGAMAVAASHIGCGGDGSSTLAASPSDVRLMMRSSPSTRLAVALGGQGVWCEERRIGRVAMLMLDPEGRMTELVVRIGTLRARDVVVPTAWMRAIDGRAIQLAGNSAALDHLPVYRPDGLIAADVERALWADEVIRDLDAETIDVRVCNGAATLIGYA